jgi:hypothetical protein
MIMPQAENQVNIEEFMCVDLFDSSSSPYCDLFEAIAPYQNIASSDQASNTIIDVMSDSSSSMQYLPNWSPSLCFLKEIFTSSNWYCIFRYSPIERPSFAARVSC